MADPFVRCSALDRARHQRLCSRPGEELDRPPRVSGVEGRTALQRPRPVAQRVCDKLAQQRKDQFISSELFVLAALDEKGTLGEQARPGDRPR